MSTFTKIVVGFDGSDQGRDALALGKVLSRLSSDELLVASVIADERADPGTEHADEVASLIGGDDVVARPLLLRGSSPARALHELVDSDPDCGLIVLGSTHRAGLGRVLPGSVAERLLSGAPCAVAVAPRGFAGSADAGERPSRSAPAHVPDIRVIAVGFDGSIESRIALERSAELADLGGAALRVVAVGQQLTPLDQSRAAERTPQVRFDDLETLLHDVVAELPSELRALPIFERGDAARVLLARAEERVDLLAVGSRGYGPLRSVLIGGVSSELVRRAPCPVLVTPRAAVTQSPDGDSPGSSAERRG